ncbi:class II aldolase/adducin family protein [Actinacidiphila paucisporea]|uniref:Class II Aldolase and Adducin N-terminal domain-containing protein n=1 Tax=Actinacidiphila paucisporea TaxID=310782 RepID=A0A1M7QF93_9ACTN|nr:class II aldolase/adducin family protein [Actinacidiphila paucisporea]SHN29272.1 Class II Aldolase and Adducin N-terminal domain-containing protein [Actinacidiphila paucisporea]
MSADDFTSALLADAAVAFRVLHGTGTLTPSATLSFVVRVPGGDQVVNVKHPDPFRPDEPPKAVPTSILDGPGALRPWGDGIRYTAVFAAHPWLGSIAHVHTPHLAAWAQAHRPFPLRYVPAQRETTAEELPVYLDRHEGEDEFILRTLAEDPDVPGILEANGGATLWSRGGLLDLARLILIVEEGARAQTLAEPLGGAREFGPGVLAQQWNAMGRGDSERARERISRTEALYAGA